MLDRDAIFVYAGDPHGDSIISPYTITQNFYKHCCKTFRSVTYLDWADTSIMPTVTKNTVIIAHPNYPKNTPAWRLFDEADRVGCKGKFLLFPFHHGIARFNWPFDQLVQRSTQMFAICGPYWYDTIDQTQFSSWKDKITRLDMAIDLNIYPMSKTTFNRHLNREFVYVGCDRPEKNMQLLYDVFSRVPQFKLHLYGNINTSHLKKSSNIINHGYAYTSTAFWADLGKTADIFVNTSISDANPTTITEAAGTGLVVACTPGSGYWPNQVFCEFPNNVDAAVTALRYLQVCPELELKAQAEKQMRWVEENCTWSKFCNTITTKIQSLI